MADWRHVVTEKNLGNRGDGGSALNRLRLLMPSVNGKDERVDWESMVVEWGTPFPVDYIAFMKEYGAGSISESCAVINPLPDFWGLGSQMAQETENALGGWSGNGSRSRADYAKAPVIAWGVTVAGDIACWRTFEKNPDDWTVMVFRASGLNPWHEYECGMVEFLRRTFSGELDECPFDDSTLWNRIPQDFIHWREGFNRLGVEAPWLKE